MRESVTTRKPFFQNDVKMSRLSRDCLTLSHRLTCSRVVQILTLIAIFNSGVSCQAQTDIKLGVMLNGDLILPYSVQRTEAAVDIAIETVNTLMPNASYKLVKVLRVYDNICDARFASGVAAELYYKERVHAIVGPGCASALDSVARLAAYWNIPIITGLGDGGQFKNKTTYPTLTRFSYCQCRLRKVFASVFREFGWSDLSIIYDMNDEHAQTLGQTLQTGLQKNNYFPYVFQYYSQGDAKLRDLLEDVSRRSRIIVLVMSGEHLREFMLTAYDMGYPQTGQYVFMNVELFPFPGSYWGDNHWKREDSRDQEAREAYESLLRVSLHLPLSPDWHNFTIKCKEISERNHNFTYGDEEVNFFVGAFHDAIMRYGRAINETLNMGGNISDGLAVTHRMWDYTSEDVTGDVIIDDNGDRDTNFAIKDMNPDTGKFDIVALYWGARPGYTAVTDKSIHWGGGRLTPPPNVPTCGFRNDDPKCEETEAMPTYMVAVIALFGVTVIAVAVGFFVYRRVMWEKDLNSTAWRVNFNDIKFRHARAHSSKLSTFSLRTRESSETASLQTDKSQSFTLVGTYKSETVAAKQVRMYKVDVTRSVLLELKIVRRMHHENITKFIGACVEPGNLHLLYEYCKKGSLQDVLLTESLKLDWTFKISLLKDIVKGMIYIHHSEIHWHGHLTSANCVVDGKFNVKVTDFGLPSFRKIEVSEKEACENAHSELQKLLWVAPEHIRNLKRVGESKKGDVFSFAIIMEEILTRSVPYDTRRALMEVEDIIYHVCRNENPPFRPEIIEHDVKECYITLMSSCWAQVPEDRPSFDAVLKSVNAFQGGKEVALVDRLLARLEEYTSNLEDIVEERTQQLAQEKRKSEMLLDEILPRSVSEKLKQGQPVDPESYDMSTIYFSDIVGFTSLSAMSTPMEVVELLNALYSRFDAAIENFDVYKVETIGDAYMVASGLPIRNGDNHVLHIARLALQLLQVVDNFVVPHRPETKLQLRIGLHSGPVVTGVVGQKMPRYCLFGDTVNTASRMESNGEARKIHISHSTKELLDKVGNFETVLRGEVEMKGKGLQTTYWLVRELGKKRDDLDKLCLSKSITSSPKVKKIYFNTHDRELKQNNNTSSSPLRNIPDMGGNFDNANDWSKDTDKLIKQSSQPYAKKIGSQGSVSSVRFPEVETISTTGSPLKKTGHVDKVQSILKNGYTPKVSDSNTSLPRSLQSSQVSIFELEKERSNSSSLKNSASPITNEDILVPEEQTTESHNGYKLNGQTSIGKDPENLHTEGHKAPNGIQNGLVSAKVHPQDSHRPAMAFS